MNQKILDAVKGRDDANQILSGLKITETTQATDQVLKAIAESIQLINGGMKVEEATAQAYNGRSKGSAIAKTKDALTAAQTQAVVAPNLNIESMPGGIKEGINNLAEHHVKGKRPNMLDQVSGSLTETSEEIINAATGYTSHATKEAWAREFNDPAFLEDLRKLVESGKSQT